MKAFLKKLGEIGLVLLIAFVLANIVALPIIFFKIGIRGISFSNFLEYLRWMLFFFFTFMFLTNVFLSHKFVEGKAQEILFLFSSSLLMSECIGYVVYSLVKCNFNFSKLDWFGFLYSAIKLDWLFYAIVFLILVVVLLIYGTFIDRSIIRFFRGGLAGKGKLKQIDANLENSRWMTSQERDKIFKPVKWSKLGSTKKDGIPVMAELCNRNKDMNVVFNSPCHAIVIGSTGSGKTTTFVSPMIQILGASAAGSSMVITDPKGELFGMHSQFLKDRGYDVKVVDLRDTYSSYRWNPLDMIYDGYQRYLFAHNDAYVRDEDVDDTGLKLAEDRSLFDGLENWYEFDGRAFATYDKLVEAIKVYKKKTFDEVYEDLNDLVSVLIPVENDKDPMWEKGARSIVLSVLLGMLEDSADERLGMTKDKFNFFNMTKILQNSADDYLELRNYFAGRSVLSKAYSLSKQVCDCAETTRASYMSIVYEKLTLFNDAGICALTSASDFTSEQLAEKPTALFLKIPDEKDTRHNLAAIFILNIYKTLIKVASATEELSLPRNVFFLMDEFGNMPKIEKFDKFITVGRSRKIWFVMIIQSYAQLNNVYGDTVADIVKGNCGIKMFIGSNDMGTCKEYSELCGNITVVTTSTSGSSQGNDVNISSQTQVRPLIYPSELQRLNHPGDIGHSIIVTFGNFPLKTYFSPSFKVPFYKFAKMDTSDTDRYFDENAILYEASRRNALILNQSDEEEQGFAGIQVAEDGQEPIENEEIESEEMTDTEMESSFEDSNDGIDIYSEDIDSLSDSIDDLADEIDMEDSQDEIESRLYDDSIDDIATEEDENNYLGGDSIDESIESEDINQISSNEEAPIFDEQVEEPFVEDTLENEIEEQIIEETPEKEVEEPIVEETISQEPVPVVVPVEEEIAQTEKTEEEKETEEKEPKEVVKEYIYQNKELTDEEVAALAERLKAYLGVNEPKPQTEEVKVEDKVMEEAPVIEEKPKQKRVRKTKEEKERELKKKSKSNKFVDADTLDQMFDEVVQKDHNEDDLDIKKQQNNSNGEDNASTSEEENHD